LLVVRGDERELWNCNLTKTSKCRPCAARYGGRVKSLAAQGFSRPGGYFYLLTLTAPSDLHYYRSGKLCECAVEGFDLSRWNPQAAKCWNRLLVSIERHYGHRPSYFRAAEVQKRGALHHHVIIRSEVALDAKSIKPLAVVAGYGHSVDLQRLDPKSRQVADYVAKYITKACDVRDSVPWWTTVVDHETGEVTEGLVAGRYRTWSQSQDYGSTMRIIRAAAQEKARELAWLRTIACGVRENSADGQDQTSPTESPPLPS
jgi:hypothetical protein